MMTMIIKTVIGWFTGNAGGLKWVLLGAIGIGSIWYLMNTYNNLKVELAETKVTLNQYQEQNKNLFQTNEKLEKEKSEVEKRYQLSIAKRQEVEAKFTKLQEDYQNDQAVFEKETGRIQRLMQKKASLVVRLANRGSDRVRREIEAAAAAQDN